jgi:hypothetical protein
MVNEFSVELKEILRTGKRFQWDGIGMMETVPGGQVILKPADPTLRLPAGCSLESCHQKRSCTYYSGW